MLADAGSCTYHGHAEYMCYALYDYPDEFVQVLNQLADDYLKFFEEWRDSGLLYPTAGYEECNQGFYLP